MSKIKVRFLQQRRFSIDGHSIKDYFPGDEIICERKDAEGTILHSSNLVPVAEIADENPEGIQEVIPEVDQRGARPDQKDVEEAERLAAEEEDKRLEAEEESARIKGEEQAKLEAETQHKLEQEKLKELETKGKKKEDTETHHHPKLKKK